MNVFVLEDEIHREPRREIVRILDAAGVQYTFATSCEEAVKLFKPNAYDLLLLDHDMRGFFETPDYPNTGYQFVRWLVTTSQRTKVPIVIHSQNPQGALRMERHLGDCGFQNTVRYPFSSSYTKWLADKFKNFPK